eukprot:323429_1
MLENNNSYGSTHEEPSKPCFLYDSETKPTIIERIFGEEYHVSDKYPNHQITFPMVLSIITIYYIQGCWDYLLIVMRYYGAAVWELGPADISNWVSLVNIGWTIKIVWGLLVDAVPLFGYKRKSYLLLSGIIAPTCILLQIIYARIYSMHVIMIVLSQGCIALCDVIADALIVERTEFKSNTVATRLQCLAWGSRSISSVTGILISTRIIQSNEPNDMVKSYWLYFGTAMLIPICAIMLSEKRITTKHSESMEFMLTEIHKKKTLTKFEFNHPSYSISGSLYLTFKTICRKCIFYPLLFIFVIKMTPISTEGVNYFLMFDLKFTSIQIGYLSLAAGVAQIIVIIYVSYRTRLNNDFHFRNTFLFWSIIATLLPFITLIIIFGWNSRINIGDFPFMIANNLILEIIIKMIDMYRKILMARICPPGVEGLFMTLLNSLGNLMVVIRNQISSFIIIILGIECVSDPQDENIVVCDFKNLWILIVIANVATLFPLVLLKFVPKNEQQMQEITEKLQENKDEKVVKSEMISVFLWFNDYIFPFIKNKILCCCFNDMELNDITEPTKS